MFTRRNFLKSATISVIGMSLSDHVLAHESISNLPGFPSENDPNYWEMIRKMFPMPEDEAYLNTGTLGAQPNFVLESVINHMRQHAVNIARCDWKDGGINLLSGYFPYTGLREKVGKLINAGYKEVALTQNATMGMNFISNGLDLKEGDEVIMTNQEHAGGRCGWELMSKRKKLILKQVPIPTPANDPNQIIDLFKEAISPKTRVIAIPHIISGFGVILPVKEICEMAKRNDIFTVIDGAQAIGHIPIDVKEINCEVYFSSPHKWLLAPAGNGILYIKNENVDEVWTTLASGQWDNHEDNGFRFTQRGTGNPALLAGLEAAIDFFNKIGPKRVTDRIKYLGDYLRDGLKKIGKVEIKSSTHPKMCSGMTTFNISGLTGQIIQDEMWERGKLQPRSVGDENGIRLSTHIYNSIKEIDMALEIVNDLANKA